MSIGMVIALCLMSIAIGVCITYKINDIIFNKVLRNKELEHEQELNKIREERDAVYEAMKTKDSYTVNMIHDVRTPINAIKGMTELILRENNSKTINEYANSIKRASNVLNELVNDTLDISKIESGNMELVEDSYDIVEVFSDVASLVKDKCNKKGLSFEVRIDENIPCTLYGDENRLRQILINLLSNAVKYTSQGKVLFEAKLKDGIKNSTADIYFAVEDTGCGIKDEDAETIFKSFKRVEKLKNSKIEGTGLGLSIVYNLLELMGSKIMLKSKYGVGSRFYFTIKQRVVDNTPIGNFITKYNEQLDKKSNYNVSFIAPNAHVLVVDDSDMNLMVTSKLLAKTQMNIDIEKSSLKALERINKKKYNVILMDVKMPEIDGVEALKRIRCGGSCNKQTPIIALTADSSIGVKEKYLDEGFSDYLSKPFDPIKLEKKVMKFIPMSLIQSNTVYRGKERRREYLLNVNEGLKYCSQDMDMYNEILAAYLQLGMENITSINKLFNDCDWKNYGIQVHSLKSTSLSVGAVKLYDMALKLEEAAKEENISDIVCNHEEMIQTYKNVLEEIEEYFNKERPHEVR